MLNPLWLKTFVILVDTGHFTKTAEKLFMTQPGVSQHINKLEQACGYRLLNREKRSFQLTERGQLVYQHAVQLNRDEQRLFEQLSFDNPYAGVCSVACSGALAMRLYPHLLQHQVDSPELIVQLNAAPNHQIMADIQQEKIDIGLVTERPNHTLYDVEELGQEELCLVLPKSAETAQSPIVELLPQLGLINHPDASHYLALYLGQNPQGELSALVVDDIPISGYINQLSQILEPVSRGLGFTLLPRSAIAPFAQPEQLYIHSPHSPAIEPIFLVKKRQRTLPARFNALLTTIAKQLTSQRE